MDSGVAAWNSATSVFDMAPIFGVSSGVDANCELNNLWLPHRWIFEWLGRSLGVEGTMILTCYIDDVK